MDVPEALRALDLDGLVGQPVADAEARVRAAGGTLRAVPPGAAVTTEYRPNRVTATVEDGRVSRVHGIG